MALSALVPCPLPFPWAVISLSSLCIHQSSWFCVSPCVSVSLSPLPLHTHTYPHGSLPTSLILCQISNYLHPMTILVPKCDNQFNFIILLICICVYIYVCMYLCVCVCIYIYIYIYITVAFVNRYLENSQKYWVGQKAHSDFFHHLLWKNHLSGLCNMYISVSYRPF